MEEMAAGGSGSSSSSSIADRVLHLHLVGEQQGKAPPYDEESEAAGAVAEEVGDAAAAAAVEEEEEEEEDEEEDEEEEDEEEEGEDDPTVLIGFLQKPDKPSSLSRHFFPSKAGGPPAWLDPINLPQGEDVLCGICHNPLQFLLQVYAPLDGDKATFHRTLFVFMCPEMACLKEDRSNHQSKLLHEKDIRSVKVFRCQLSQVNGYYSKEPPRKGVTTPTTPGAPLCSWCGTWKGQKLCSSCKQVRYCSRQHQVKHWKAGHAAECVNQVNAEKSIKNDLHNHPTCKLWPEFEIIDEEEGTDDERTKDGDMAIITSGKRDDISMQFEEPSMERKHWADFQARLSRAPDQVLRYCRSPDAKPLWPRLDERPINGCIPACSVCKGRRIFEFQVLPQLLYFFHISNDADALDWGTIAVYSCESSCKSSEAYVQEFAWVQSA